MAGFGRALRKHPNHCFINYLITAISKTNLLSLLGHLNFAMRVIPQGPSFITRLLDLSKTENNLADMVSLDEGCAASHKREREPQNWAWAALLAMPLTMAHEGQVTALPASGFPVQGIPEQNHTTKCNLCNCAIKMLILTVTLSEKCSFICDNHKFHLVALFFQSHRLLSYVLLILRTYRLSLTYTSFWTPAAWEIFISWFAVCYSSANKTMVFTSLLWEFWAQR